MPPAALEFPAVLAHPVALRVQLVLLVLAKLVQQVLLVALPVQPARLA